MTIRNKTTPLFALVLVGCASTQTRLGTVSSADVATEQATQGVFALKALLALQARVTDVAYPLLISAAPLCVADVRRSMGLTVANARDFSGNAYQAARTVGLDDTLRIIHVATGSGAERAGLREGDAIVAIDTTYLKVGQDAEADWFRVSGIVGGSSAATTRVRYHRGAADGSVDVSLDVACGYTVIAYRADELNAYSDGKSVYVTSAIVRFVADDDELATVLSHEIAHNAMHHIQAKEKNSLLGALLGAVVDIGAAFGHYNTHGAYSQIGAQAGARKFSQDFEREADYVGLYIMALAQRPIDKTPNFWRRMASENPTSITFASSHPTTAERFVRLEQWTIEIQTKLASGAALRPEMKAVPGDLASATTQSSPDLSEGQASGLLSGRSRLVTAGAAVSPSAPTRSVGTAAPGPTGADRPQAVARAVPDTIRIESSNGNVVLTPTQGGPHPTEPVPPYSASIGSAETAVATEQIGAARSAADARDARAAYRTGEAYLERHEWGNAEQWLRKAVLLDGGKAVYHAELGQVLIVESRWPEAEAAFTAAVLLDVDNAEYRRLLKEARSH